jgi:hypothetical protein
VSDGTTASPITLTDTSPSHYNPGQGTQGTVAGLEAPYLLEKNGSVITETLSNVPTNTYNLYLYGKNDNGGDANRGTTFTACTSLTPATSQSTVNSVTMTFTQGNDYVEFTNLVVGTDGKITFTYTANPAATGTPGNNEGDFNGLQLVAVSTITNSPPMSYAPPAQSISMTNGWQLQSASKVSDSGNVISRTNYQSDNWYPATVPGTVLTTLVNNRVYPEPLYGTNNYAIPDSLCHTSYWYRTVFTVPTSYTSNRVWLNFGGINYTANVWLNGSSIGIMQGAFARGVFDITSHVNVGGTNALAVLISPEPNPGTPHQKMVATGAGGNGGDTETDGPAFLCTVGWDWFQPYAIATREFGAASPCRGADRWSSKIHM